MREHYIICMHNIHELCCSAAVGACAIVLRISKCSLSVLYTLPTGLWSPFPCQSCKE